MSNQPLYYADGEAVMKRPVKTENKDGSSNITMGYMVCRAGPGVDPQDIANNLNEVEVWPSRYRSVVHSRQQFRAALREKRSELAAEKRTVEQLHHRLTCMCGSLVDEHSIGSGHSPVSMYDYALDQAEQRVRDLERAYDFNKAIALALRAALKDLYRAFMSRHGCFPNGRTSPQHRHWNRAMSAAKDLLNSSDDRPIPMVLYCPNCGHQHIDAPNEDKGWSNPPHRSHECQRCGHTWRPADIPTTGVAEIRTKGQKDSPPPVRDMVGDWPKDLNINQEPLPYWKNRGLS